ncbi:Epimerase family protein [Planctomycetes bacterium Pan216]|uniref:Epimerase family protein n=1 Tax=Kolteria novifilia TaxID=2527975 RepID=A0A518B1P0_9BACT|nr:Epimerase family protein [Planctomycetes bacterium Pan216]
MKVAITGASGLIGTRLTQRLEQSGHEVLAISRSAGDESVLRWDPAKGEIDAQGLQGVDAVINLAGENIASRWTDAKKRAIRESRVDGTSLIARTIAALDPKPSVLVSASAIGYYGDRGDEVMTEQSAAGDGFLPDVCVAWEEAADPARDAGIRVVHPRIGVVLSPDGGALAQMLTPFKLGGGGKLGSGNQYFSWITIDDVVGVLEHCLNHDQCDGPLNAVSPNPVTNKVFTKTLGKVLGRPTVIPMPAFAARMAFGEMADALLLASTRVVPNRASESGFTFGYPDLEEGLRHLLKT